MGVAVVLYDEVVDNYHGYTCEHEHTEGEQEVKDDQDDEMDGGESAHGDEEEHDGQEEALAHGGHSQTTDLAKGAVADDGAVGLECIEHDARDDEGGCQPIEDGELGNCDGVQK